MGFGEPASRFLAYQRSWRKNNQDSGRKLKKTSKKIMEENWRKIKRDKKSQDYNWNRIKLNHLPFFSGYINFGGIQAVGNQSTVRRVSETKITKLFEDTVPYSM